MKAMILAAGLGKRMRPLTARIPKPLIEVGGKYLIEYHLENIAKTSIKDVVINTHWLAEQIPAALGDGSRWDLNIKYSHEPELLETAGGIVNAMPLLADFGADRFLLLNGDVYTELDLSGWINSMPEATEGELAHLALVKNPLHNPEGDFSLSDIGKLSTIDPESGRATYTYSGIGLYRTEFFDGVPNHSCQLGPLLKQYAEQGKLSASIMQEYWQDVGTPDRLEEINQRLNA